VPPVWKLKDKFDGLVPIVGAAAVTFNVTGTVSGLLEALVAVIVTLLV